MGVRILALGLLALFVCGCRKPEPVLQAGETLLMATEEGSTQSYVAEVPSNWQRVEGKPDFQVDKGDATVTVLVHWSPSKDVQESLNFSSAEGFYQNYVVGALERGGQRVKWADFSGSIEVFNPPKMAEELMGRRNITLMAQDEMSIIIIDARMHDSSITQQEIIDFAKSIRKP